MYDGGMCFKSKLYAVLLVVAVEACGGPPPPKAPAAPVGVTVTIDTTQRNPVITWNNPPSGIRATILGVMSPNCRHGELETKHYGSTRSYSSTVTAGKEAGLWGLLEPKGEGFNGPVVYGSHVPGTDTTQPAIDVPVKCEMTVVLIFSDLTQIQKTFQLSQPTLVAEADADMKKLGYDKPWVSTKPVKVVPPPDAALQADFAGTYKCVSIGGKALPYDYGNGCAMTSVTVEAAADGSYKSGYTMSCKTGPIDGSDTGTYGVTATGAAFSKDPDTDFATREPDGFTRTYGGQKYVFKRTAKPAAAQAAAPAAAP